MTIEVRQLIVTSRVVQDLDGKGGASQRAAKVDSTELRRELERVCQRWLDERAIDTRER